MMAWLRWFVGDGGSCTATRSTPLSKAPAMRRLTCFLLTVFATLAQADEIGSVDTVFKFIGPDHKIVVEAHDDPGVSGVTCYMSRARTGGISGALNFNNALTGTLRAGNPDVAGGGTAVGTFSSAEISPDVTALFVGWQLVCRGAALALNTTWTVAFDGIDTLSNVAQLAGTFGFVDTPAPAVLIPPNTRFEYRWSVGANDATSTRIIARSRFALPGRF